MEKLKVFISSTIEDLQPERNAVERVVSTFCFQTLRAETTGAQAKTPHQTCLDMARECNIYVGIYGPRYGWVPGGEEASVTELEFREAQRCGKDMLVYVKKSKSGEKRQQDFIRRVEDFETGCFRRPPFTSIEELAGWVKEDLSQLVSMRYGRPAALNPAQVAKHLRAVLVETTYERWSDDRRVGGKVTLLPMNVRIYDDDCEGRSARLPKEGLMEALSKSAQRVVILGDPGAGKTTALERLMWVTAKTSLDDSEHPAIPVFVPLSSYGGERDLLPLVRAALNRQGVLNLSLRGVEDVLVSLPCFLLLDGLNEMGEFREQGVKAAVKHMDTYPAHRYCLTCRTEDYRDYRGELGVVREFVLQELDDEVGHFMASARVMY